MSKLLMYGGISLSGLLGAYLPVLLFHADPLGLMSIVSGLIGSFVGLWLGYKANQYIDD